MTVPTPLHLWTGVTVCSELRSWCGAAIETQYDDVEGKLRVLNATDVVERSTCDACLREMRRAEVAAKLLRRKPRGG